MYTGVEVGAIVFGLKFAMNLLQKMSFNLDLMVS